MDRSPYPSENVALTCVAVAAGAEEVLWAAGALSALLSGHAVPRGHPLAGVLALADPGRPSDAWHAAVGPTAVYWLVTALVLAAVTGALLAVWHTVGAVGLRPVREARDGLATRAQVVRAAGRRALLRKAGTLRPAVDWPAPGQVGYLIGRAHGVECWVSVEDSIVLLGPPRSGKGLHTVIPAILDAPGAVVTTSTRPDNLAATIAARRQVGPVAVFDPQGLAVGVPAAMRWSPIRGCHAPAVAMARARALCAEPAGGMENASFWTQQCLTAVRCLLHAAALSGSDPVELMRWSLSPIAAEQAGEVLRTHPKAAPGWATGLETILASDPRQRDSTWAMVANTFAALADPQVLDAVSPRPSEHFDPARFLTGRGTLFLLGTASGASATANLVSAFIEDIVESARRLAARSPGARLDPPLAIVLDEAANYPLPSLPALMSEGGGTGITTLVALQSLAQARARWGQQQAAAIWDAAIVKLVLGGSGNAEDLRDLATLIGTRETVRVNQSWGPDGRRSASTSAQETPVLEAGQLRTLPFGQAVLLLRAAPPIRLTLQPWTRRRDAGSITAARTETEALLRDAEDRTA